MLKVRNPVYQFKERPAEKVVDPELGYVIPTEHSSDFYQLRPSILACENHIRQTYDYFKSI